MTGRCSRMRAKKMTRLNLQQFASSADYWRKREERNLKSNLKQEAEYDKEIERIYKDMLDATQKEIDAFFGKYADAEGITLAEAKKRVSQLDIEAYERKAKKYVEAASQDRANTGKTNKRAFYFSKRANEEMRLYNLTMKVNRLEMLKANIGLELIKGHAELETFMSEILQGRTKEELERQAGILGKSIKNNAKLADTIVNASFKNATFSDRLWMYHDQMKADLSKLLQSGMIQGKNSRQLAKDLRKYYYGPEYLKNGKKGAVYNTERLMRTELARVQTEAQRQSFERNGFNEYTFLALGDACDICKAIDGKHFKVKDMMPGENAPPIHPHCRCSISAYEDTEEYEAWLDFLDNGGTTADWNRFGKAAWKESGIISPIPNNKSEELTNRRKERLAARRAKEQNPQTVEELQKYSNDLLKKHGVNVNMSDTNSKHLQTAKENIDHLNNLLSKYMSTLKTFVVQKGAVSGEGGATTWATDKATAVRVLPKELRNIAAAADELRLGANKKFGTVTHEFAHTLSSAGRKIDPEFWKEINRIKRAYVRELGQIELGKSKYSKEDIFISDYARKNADEFMAEAFTQALLAENPSPFALEVLKVVDKYFKK